MATMYIGVDNGVSGALAAISEAHGKIIGYLPMPVVKARSGNEVDIRAVHLWISETCPNLSNATFVIEEPGGSKSASAARSMAGSFHSMRALFEVKFLCWHRITPQSWQKKLLPGCKAGDTKARAYEMARRLWPEESFVLPGCRKPNDGIVDACLIAYHARKERL